MLRRIRAILLAALTAGLATAGVALAQSSVSFDLSWNVLGGGGGDSESASFAVDSTIGQPVVGRSQSASVGLDAGYWSQVAGEAGAVPTTTPGPTATPGPEATKTPGPKATPSGDLVGDANCDGTVNAVDAAFVLQFSAGLLGEIPCADLADANANGEVTAVDAALILQFGAGLIGTLPP